MGGAAVGVVIVGAFVVRLSGRLSGGTFFVGGGGGGGGRDVEEDRSGGGGFLGVFRETWERTLVLKKWNKKYACRDHAIPGCWTWHLSSLPEWDSLGTKRTV